MDKPNKRHYDNWQEANPIRIETITRKGSASKITGFEPYIDCGLVNNNDVADSNRFVSIVSPTLAFFQQAADIKDKLVLTVAGIATTHISWTNNLLATNIYKPLVKTHNLKDTVIAFGGAAGSNTTNPWSVVLKIANNDETKASEMLKTSFLDLVNELVELGQGSKDDCPRKLDFDIEGGSIVSDLADHQFLIKVVAEMKMANNELSNFESSFTLPVLPTGLTPDGLKIVDNIIKTWKKANLDLETLPIINLMTMDYGEYYYDPKKTNFDLLQKAVENTKEQLKELILESYQKKVDDQFLFPKLGCTPMIGINDQLAFVFTLEDAKELYNWANEKNLGVIRTWSFNDDSPIDINGTYDKTVNCHGLNYLNEYDFAKALTGNWDELVQNPYTSPKQSLVQPVAKDINDYIHKTYLGDISNNSSDFLLAEVNKQNNCNFTYYDIKISSITEYQATFTGRRKYKENVTISFHFVKDKDKK